MFEADFIHAGVPDLRHAHAPSLAENAHGDLIAAWYGYPDVEYERGRIVVARRPRDAAGWTTQSVLFDGVKSSLGNPVLFHAADGTLHLLCALVDGLYWTDAVLLASHSHDDGRTWARPRQLPAERGLMVRHAPIERSDGSWLLPAYDERRRAPVVMAAAPPSWRWEPIARFPGTGLIQPALVRDAATLVMLLRPTDLQRVVWRSDSHDEGATWTAPSPTPLATAPSGLAAFRWNDALAIVHNPTTGHERHPLSLSVAGDACRTWVGPRHLDTACLELSYPCFRTGRDGRVHGLYTYNRRFIKYVTFDAAWWNAQP